jgi:hypothetical protein
MYHSTHSLRAETTDKIFHVDPPTMKAHWDAFAPVYYGTNSTEELEAEARKLRPFLAVKMAFLLSKLSDGKHAFAGFMQQMLDSFLPE